MATKTVSIEGIGAVQLVKRRASRSIRLSFTREGEVKVTLPYFVPFAAGVDFVMKHRDWIERKRPAKRPLLRAGDRIGKAHRLVFMAETTGKPRSSVRNNQVIVAYTHTATPADPAVQSAAIAAAERALKKEAERLLPQRLKSLAASHGFDYKTVQVRNLKSRWGSCNSQKEIKLSYYLMQLPWQLIDYVLVHELVHTEHLDHSRGFWKRFETILPAPKQLRKILREYQPIVLPGQ